MEAEDLMIGDWVYFCHHDEWDSKTICKVSLLLKDNTEFIEDTFKTKVSKKGIIQVEAIDGFQFWRMQEGINFEPIPLTSEILEKNGCKRYDEATRRDGLYKYEVGSRCIVVFDLNPARTPFIECENATCRMIRKIIYIHELQHALRLCGIDKEIVL